MLLGSNLGNRRQTLGRAVRNLNTNANRVVRLSSLYESEPWGFEAENDFLNQVVELETQMSPHQLLHFVLETEKKLGRKPKPANQIGYCSRKIDIDILFFGRVIVKTPRLSIPHPHLHVRRFTLLPLAELCPDKIHPLLKQTMTALLANCPDRGKVRPIRLLAKT